MVIAALCATALLIGGLAVTVGISLLPMLTASALVATGSGVMVSSENPDIVYQVDDASEQFKAAYLDGFGFDVDLSQVTVKVRNEDITVGGRAVNGFTLGNVVEVKAPNDIIESAYLHELVHVALFQEFGDSDANHEKPPGPWTTEHQDFVNELRARLKDSK